jgi:multidrug efflux system membrane fusion protein
MRKGPVVLTVLLIGIAAAGAAWWHRSRAAPTPEAPPPPTPVVAAAVAAHPVPIYLRGVGTVIAFNNVVLRSQITGPLIKIGFRQGQTVRKGDVLAEIDPRPYQAQLDQAIANRDRDQAQLLNAQANLDRYVPLQTKGFATGQLVDTQKAQVAQMQATVKADQAVIENAQVNLGYTKLIAPIDGVTGIRQIDEGNIIHPTDTNGLVDLTQIQPISLIFTLPQATFPEIQQEMAKGPVKVLAYSQDETTRLDEGELLLIDNQINQTTGTIRLRATFPNAQRLLWPGELVNARLLLRTEPDGLTIAAGAVQQGPNGSYVYVIMPDQSVQVRPVKIAQISEGQALIDSGLKANETVVVDGQYKLQPGTHVKTLHGKAAQQADMQSAVQQAIP